MGRLLGPKRILSFLNRQTGKGSGTPGQARGGDDVDVLNGVGARTRFAGGALAARVM